MTLQSSSARWLGGKEAARTGAHPQPLCTFPGSPALPSPLKAPAGNCTSRGDSSRAGGACSLPALSMPKKLTALGNGREGDANPGI